MPRLVCICVYIYIYISLSLSLSLSAPFSDIRHAFVTTGCIPLEKDIRQVFISLGMFDPFFCVHSAQVFLCVCVRCLFSTLLLFAGELILLK